MSPNLPSTCLWPTSQLLLPPVKLLAPPQLAFFGIAVIAVRSTPLMFLSYRFYLILAWDPTRKAGTRNAPGQGQVLLQPSWGELQLEEPRSPSLQRYWYDRHQTYTPTLPAAGEDFRKKTTRLLLLCSLLHLDGGSLHAQRKFLCCRGIYFSFLLSWPDGKQQEEERPAEVALQVDLKRIHFSRKTKKKWEGRKQK